MSGTGGINSLKMVLEHLKRHLDTVISGFWDVVACLGRLEAATQGVVLDSQAVQAELVGLLGIV